MRKYKLFLILILLVTLAGCGAAQHNEVYPETYPNTMLIVNDGIDQIRVYENDGVGYTVPPSQARCIRLRNPYSAQMSFSVLGQRGRWYTPEQSYETDMGWLWVITPHNAAMSTTRIVEAEPCTIGTTYASNHAYYRAYRSYGYSYYSSLTFRPYYVYGYGYDYYVSWRYWNRPNYVFIRYVDRRPTVVAQNPRPRNRVITPRRPSNGDTRGRRTVAPTPNRRNVVTPRRTSPTRLRSDLVRRRANINPTPCVGCEPRATPNKTPVRNQRNVRPARGTLTRSVRPATRQSTSTRTRPVTRRRKP